MSDPKDEKTTDPILEPISQPRPPEMDLEPIPLPDLSGAATDEVDELPAETGRVPPVPSRDEANIGPDDVLPEDSEEKLLEDDPARERTRFDEELPKSSR
ncbi:hypothetical protein LPJGGPFB_04858 [Ensifer adhaerens]|uniref:hypothetical protein n=1 Tax=Ensifer adhaerens TaxID=106592 RepID=UPI001568D2BE|nr:hypothetical protein [Ensifer adhaerens]NRP21599.1 hypothetical protein [Ensifer adhaerens]